MIVVLIFGFRRRTAQMRYIVIDLFFILKFQLFFVWGCGCFFGVISFELLVIKSSCVRLILVVFLSIKRLKRVDVDFSERINGNILFHVSQWRL